MYMYMYMYMCVYIYIYIYIYMFFNHKCAGCASSASCSLCLLARSGADPLWAAKHRRSGSHRRRKFCSLCLSERSLSPAAFVAFHRPIPAAHRQGAGWWVRRALYLAASAGLHFIQRPPEARAS